MNFFKVFKNLSKLDKIFIVLFVLVLIGGIDSTFTEIGISILGLLFWYGICRIIKNIISKKRNKSVVMPEHVIVHIDTTGLDAKKDEILRITALRVVNGKVVDIFNELVKPKVKITKEITKINGISNEMVANSQTILEVLPKFKNFLKDDDIIVGYNVRFHTNFLFYNFLKTFDEDGYFNYTFIDVMDLAINILKKKLSSKKMLDVVRVLKIKDKSSDFNIDANTYYCFAIFNSFAKYIVSKNGEWNIDFLKECYALDDKLEL